MRVFIMGGTGFLGYYSALSFLKKGHSVSVFALPDIPLGSWYPSEIHVEHGDVFKMTEAEINSILLGYDALVYALGPDDRFTPDAPAYDFFHKFLVEECSKVVRAARNAGIKRCVVLNSYFCTFDRLHPEWKLAQYHPYIKCRVEQAESVISIGENEMDVMVLELPYIFGTMPERVPLWKDVLLERIRTMNPVFFTKGGTTMIAVENVGEAVSGAIEHGRHGERYPIGDVNMDWKTMLGIMLNAMGIKNRKIITLPTFLVSLYGQKLRKEDFKKGKEAGLDHQKLFHDIQSRYLYLDPTPSVEILKYSRGGVVEAIEKTVKTCYPDLI